MRQTHIFLSNYKKAEVLMDRKFEIASGALGNTYSFIFFTSKMC